MLDHGLGVLFVCGGFGHVFRDAGDAVESVHATAGNDVYEVLRAAEICGFLPDCQYVAVFVDALAREPHLRVDRCGQEQIRRKRAGLGTDPAEPL